MTGNYPGVLYRQVRLETLGWEVAAAVQMYMQARKTPIREAGKTEQNIVDEKTMPRIGTGEAESR